MAIHAGLEELIREIRLATDAGLFYIALFGVLALPDICGALSSDDGKASGPKYIEWIEGNVPENKDEASRIYGLRNSLLHQGRAHPHKSPFAMAFMFPAPEVVQLHRVRTIVQDEVHWISIPTFVTEVTTGVERWLQKYGATQTVQRNLEKFARFRPEGLPPHVSGPVIA